MKKNPNIVAVSGRKLACLKRYNTHEPEAFTKFYVTPPLDREGQWRIRSVVQDELEGEAAVVILLRKGLKVDEATRSLYEIAMLLKKAKKEATGEQSRLQGIALGKKQLGFLMMIFNLPLRLIYRGLAFIKGKWNG